MVYFTAGVKQRMFRSNSQILSGADEWRVAALVIFINGQYGAIKPCFASSSKKKKKQHFKGENEANIGS